MTIQWNIILQGVATTLQMLNASGVVFSQKGQVISAAVLGGLQIIVSGLAHYSPSPANVSAPPAAPPAAGVPKVLALLALVPLLGGCINGAAMIDALAKDNATGCLRVSTPWGSVDGARTNITAGDVKCNGLEVRTPGVATVPVTVRPVVQP
jgi:hypothetical protein